MIVYPSNWQEIGVPINVSRVDTALRQAVDELPCNNLSFSGGLDSSLLLYYLLELKKGITCFTVVNDAQHPDLRYSIKVIDWFERKYNVSIEHTKLILPTLSGDTLVREYYRKLEFIIESIIVGDCADELSCGYYAHQDLQEKTYQEYLNKLQLEHLKPLNANSGNVKVYMPYANDKVLSLFLQMPLYDKVSLSGRKLINLQVAKGKIPAFVIYRKKYGFATTGEHR